LYAALDPADRPLVTDALRMIEIARRGLTKVLALLTVIMFAVAATGSPAAAEGLFGQVRYAAIVVDASTGEVLYAKRADDLRYPASITKIMTLYLTFEALSTGRLKPTDLVAVSQHAASMIPSKSPLRPGESLTVDQAIRIVAVHSANDIAVALAEKIGGSESRFAALMTLRAQELGMANTRFVNANGVPDSRQVTTARDIAILSRAVMRDYPQYYSYFGLRETTLRGKVYPNHNHLLREPGYDGFKTGFTNAAGFNLSASAVRDGRRLITVVLGGSSAALRDENVQTLMNAGFDVLRKRSLGVKTTIAANIAEPEDSGPITRPSIEQGDGSQAGLNIVVADSLHSAGFNQVSDEEHADPIDAKAPPPGLRGRLAARVKPSELAAASACVAGRGRHRHAVACKSAPVEVAAAAPDCAKKHGKAKRSCERQAAPMAQAKAAKAHGRHKVETAKAAPRKKQGKKTEVAKAASAKAKVHAKHHHADA
jgi:D-alanyl-D-alanine carboxypeptidase (penicillin-binding protein 5/6)